MTQQLPAHFSETTAGELQDLIPRLGLFADENAVANEALRDALMDDLAPASPYEQAFADTRVTGKPEMPGGAVEFGCKEKRVPVLF